MMPDPKQRRSTSVMSHNSGPSQGIALLIPQGLPRYSLYLGSREAKKLLDYTNTGSQYLLYVRAVKHLHSPVVRRVRSEYRE